MSSPRFFDPGQAPQQRPEQEATAEALEALFEQVSLIGKAAEPIAGVVDPETATGIHLVRDGKMKGSTYSGLGGVAAAFNHVQHAFAQACSSSSNPELRALVARREAEERQKREAQGRQQQRRHAPPGSAAATRQEDGGGLWPEWGQLGDGDNPEGKPMSWSKGALFRGVHEMTRRYMDVALPEPGDTRWRPPPPSRTNCLLSGTDELFAFMHDAKLGMGSLGGEEGLERCCCRVAPRGRRQPEGVEEEEEEEEDSESAASFFFRLSAAGLLDEPAGGGMLAPMLRLTAMKTSMDAQVPHPMGHSVGLAPDNVDVLYGRAGEVSSLLELVRSLDRFVVDVSPSSSSSPAAIARVAVSKLGEARQELEDAVDKLCAFLLREGQKNFAVEGGGGIGKGGGTSSSSSFGLLFNFHGKEYLGAAHGLCGILHVLASAAAAFGGDGGLPRSRRAGLAQALEWGVGHLLDNTINETGNLRTAPGSTKDELVQWCHGSPGLLFLEAALEDMHRDRRIGRIIGSKEEETLLPICGGGKQQRGPPTDLAVSAASAARLRAATAKALPDIASRRGFLTKGLGLCHGLSGNGYALLAFARARRLARARGAESGEGKEEEEEASRRDAEAALAGARRFRDVIASRWQEFAEVPDKSPAGLYTGMAGSVCFLADTIFYQGKDLEMHARMPGYCFW